MRILRGTTCFVVSGFLLAALEGSAQEPRFRGTFAIEDVPRPVTVHAGDIDGDGKLDLIASSGTSTVIVYFQDPKDRFSWTPVSIPVGAACFFTRAGDFDGDGFDDLAVADGGSTTYVVRSRGDRTFEPPQSLPEARGSRWIAVGDWDNDGNLDLASSNLSSGTLTIFVGDGEFNFTLTGSPPSHREHTLETLDYDGDGNLDLAMGTGLPGIQLHQGQGDGTFQYRTTIPGHNGLLGCVEYIAVGDFNNDGLDDMAPTCIDDGTAYAGISHGDGGYTRILKYAFDTGTESSAIGDFNGDGNDDLALVSNGSSFVEVYLGKGDATFEEPVLFGYTGFKPVFLIAEDLDRDGHVDVVSADEGSSSLSILFGQEGEQFLDGPIEFVSGYDGASAIGVADFDLDGLPDFFYTDHARGIVRVYLAPGVSTPTAPDLSITTTTHNSVLHVADLNDDGIVDLVSGTTRSDAIRTYLLDADGSPGRSQRMPDCHPRKVTVAFLNDGPVDIVALCAPGRDAEVKVFHGRGDGTFGAVPPVPTIDWATLFDVDDIDGDGRIDIGVVAREQLAIHYGVDGGSFSPSADVIEGANRRFVDIKLADIDGDGSGDVLAADALAKEVLLYKGKGAREFEDPLELSIEVTPSLLDVVDFDLDGDLDIAVTSGVARNVAIFRNLGAQGFAAPRFEFLGVPPLMLRIIDVNADGVNDLVGFGRTTTVIRIGEPDTKPTPGFQRGDADGDGQVILTDAIVVLNYLFREGSPRLSCPDAADTNDDAVINLTDPVAVLNYLFQKGEPPAPPGPAECGEDTTGDELPTCGSRC